MIRAVLALGVAGLLLSHATPARADCAAPQLSFAPVSGESIAVVANTSTSWLFTASWAKAPTIEARSKHERVTAEISKVSENSAFIAYQILVRFDGAPVDYDIVADGKTASYRVDAKSAAAASGPVSMSAPEYTSSAWSCSHTNSVTATPNITTSAYRIEWAETEADYRTGKREAVVVPANMSNFFSGEKLEAQIALGHLSCFGETIPEVNLTRGVYVGVAALISGGEAVPTNPTYVKAGDPLEFFEVKADEPAELEEPQLCGYAYSQQIRMEEERQAREAAPPRSLALLGLFFGVLLGIGAGRKLSDGMAARLDAFSLPQVTVVLAALAATMSQTAALGMSAATAVAIGLLAFTVGAFASVIAVIAQRSR